jgi:very-short-patch-repair endonuclease
VNTHAYGFERDFHWPELGLAVEIDGPGHTRAPTRDADASRDESLVAAGYTVARFSAAEVAYQPAEVLSRLRTQAPHARAR